MTNDKPMTSVVDQLRRHTSPTALSGTQRAPLTAGDLTFAEARALLHVEGFASTNTLAALDAVIEHINAILARDEAGAFPRERRHVQEVDRGR